MIRSKESTRANGHLKAFDHRIGHSAPYLRAFPVANSTLWSKNQPISAGKSRICQKIICSSRINDLNVRLGGGHLAVEMVEGQETWNIPRGTRLHTRRQKCQRALKLSRFWALLPLWPLVVQHSRSRFPNRKQCRSWLSLQWERCKSSPGLSIVGSPLSPPRGPGHLKLGRLSCLTQSKLSWSSGPHSFFPHVLRKSQCQWKSQWSWKSQQWKRCNIFSGSARVADPIHPVCLSAAPAGFLLPENNSISRGRPC